MSLPQFDKGHTDGPHHDYWSLNSRSFIEFNFQDPALVTWDPLGLIVASAVIAGGYNQFEIDDTQLSNVLPAACALLLPLVDDNGRRLTGGDQFSITSISEIDTPFANASDLWFAAGIADTADMSGQQVAGGIHYDVATPECRSFRGNGSNDSATSATGIHCGFSTCKDLQGNIGLGHLYDANWLHVRSMFMGGTAAWTSANVMYKFVAFGSSSGAGAGTDTIEFKTAFSHVTARYAGEAFGEF